MSNLSDIGFPVAGNEQLNKLIEDALQNVSQIPSRKGTYLKFADQSGAEIYLQMNFDGELTGMNPYFAGKSRRKVFVTAQIERDSSPLDGGFHAWANADQEGEGDYPFVFDLPDIFVHQINLPTACEIQLNAFATNDLQVYADAQSFHESQTSDPKFSANSFIPIGLFNENRDIPPQAHGQFAGTIKQAELKKNQFTGAKFYWFLVETLGGEIDVVSDPNYVKIEPQTGSIVHGSFWLTGKILAD